MGFLSTNILLFLLLCYHLPHLTVSQPHQNKTYLKTQYKKDIKHLNDKITNYHITPQSYISILPLPNQTHSSITNTIYLQPQVVYLSQNQFVELSYPNVYQSQQQQQTLIDITIRQALLAEKDIQAYLNAQDHYKLNSSHFTNNKSTPTQFHACKLNDPQIQYQKLYSISLMGNRSYKSPNQQQIVLHLTELGEYRVIRLNDHNQLNLYSISISERFDYYSQSSIIHIMGAYVVDDDEVSNDNNTNGIDNDNSDSPKGEMFLFKYQNERVMVYDSSDGDIFQVMVRNDHLEVNKYGRVVDIVHDDKKGGGEQTSSSSPSDDNNKTNKHTKQKPIKIHSLKFGFLIQYETYFQIYLQQQSSTNSQQQSSSPPLTLKPFHPQLSRTSLLTLTNSQPITSLTISQQLSHQSGYKIYLLLQSSLLIQFQYGSYSSISLFKIQFGDSFHHLAVKQDIVEIIFSVSKGKRTLLYGMELVIDRKVNNNNNPRNPNIYLNRFYNDLKDFNKVEFYNGKQLLLIGQNDILIYNWPVSSHTLITQNITQTPYHFPIYNLESIHSLQRYSSSNTNYVLIVSKTQLIIAALKRSPQTITCSSDKSIDSRIQILKFCDTNRQQICRYVASLRVVIQNVEAQRINTIKRYLMILLILAIMVSIFVVVRQICQNRKTIQKLQKLKQKINKKYSELQTKGKKVTQEDKFEQLQEEIQQKNADRSQKSKKSKQ